MVSPLLSFAIANFAICVLVVVFPLLSFPIAHTYALCVSPSLQSLFIFLLIYLIYCNPNTLIILTLISLIILIIPTTLIILISLITLICLFNLITLITLKTLITQ